MKKAITIIIACVFLSGTDIQAQEEPVSNKVLGNNVGLFAGTSAGYGISYRYFPDKVGLQITTTPVISHNGSHVSLGGELLTSINRYKITNLYAYLGYHYNYTKTIEEWDSNRENIDVTHITGLGVGFELVAGNRVGFNWQLGYAFYYFNEDDWQTMLDFGFGVYFKF